MNQPDVANERDLAIVWYGRFMWFRQAQRRAALDLDRRRWYIGGLTVVLAAATGLLYSVWRLTSKYQGCPVCGQPGMVPVGSPVGQRLLVDRRPASCNAGVVAAPVRGKGMFPVAKLLSEVVCTFIPNRKAARSMRSVQMICPHCGASVVPRILAVVALMAIGAGPALADWQYTKWGMTPEQVIAAADGKTAFAGAVNETNALDSFDWSVLAPPVSSELRSWSGRVVGIPGEPSSGEKRGGGGGSALPTFRAVVTSEGKRYTVALVGSSFLSRGARNLTVPVQIIPVSLAFQDGTVLDPTQPDPCSGGATPLDLVLQSPLFQNVDYQTDGVARQFVEEIRREEFWYYTGPGRLNPSYSLRLAPSVLPTIPVTLPASVPTVMEHCGRAAVINGGPTGLQLAIKAFFASPQARSLGVSPRALPLFLFQNVAYVLPQGTAVGFHSAFGGQTYGVATFDSTQSGETLGDISVLSHELAEWAEDPFVNNATPPWGRIGQVSGCQSTYEVGDPLTGHLLAAVQMPNGFTYHLQETAYFSWFYDFVPSIGYAGWYSSNNTFTSPASPCH